MKRTFLLLSLLAGLFFSLTLNAESAKQYGVAKEATPVFNVSDLKPLFAIDADRRSKLSDDCYHMKELEFIALPKTTFIIEETTIINGITVDKVTIPEYPYPGDTGYYVDDRFVKHLKTEPKPRAIDLPSKQDIMNKMLAVQGERYTWGGNYHKGTAKLFKSYGKTGNRKSGVKIDAKISDRLKFKGLDCSGLLYEATNGFTPRNTSKLITFGDTVEIAGLSVDELIQKVEPLDLIVWRGHMMVILDKDKIIESREDYEKNVDGCQGGVRVRALRPVLEDLLATKYAITNYDAPVPKDKKKFVIRRWYPHDNEELKPLVLNLEGTEQEQKAKLSKQLPEIIGTKLSAWVNLWQRVLPNFSLSNFKVRSIEEYEIPLLSPSEKMIEKASWNYRRLGNTPNLTINNADLPPVPLEIYSLDKLKYITLLNCLIYDPTAHQYEYGCDDSSEVWLTDITKRLGQMIKWCGVTCSLDYAVWINNDVFALAGFDMSLDKDNVAPFVPYLILVDLHKNVRIDFVSKTTANGKKYRKLSDLEYAYWKKKYPGLE